MRSLQQTFVIFGLLCLQLLVCTSTNAHVVYVYSEDGKIKVVFGEGLEPDQKVFLAGLKEMKSFTTIDETGSIVLAPATRYLVRAKHVIEEAGELNGKTFSERRYYCTMVLDVGNEPSATEDTADMKTAAKTKAQIGLKKVDAKYADLPRGMTSFGATVVDDHVYVIGGKSGRAHSYAKSYQNRDVYCLDLSDDSKQWKTVSDNLGLQGLAAVGHKSKVYRIGGLEARNAEDEEHDLHSISEVLEFNPADQTWKNLSSLPEGRSSIDSCVADGKIFVVGGWTMAGEKESEWAKDMLVYDLSKPKGTWERIASPFQTRALAVRAHQGNLVAVGGLDKAGGTTAAVHIFNIENRQWSAGPEVPAEGGMKAFGCSAVTLGDHLLVSTYDGHIFRLSDDLKSWEVVHRLEQGRFFHQMLPVGDSKFAIVGGTHMEHGRQQEVEVFEIFDKQ